MVNTFEQIKEKVSEEFNKGFFHECYILYFHDSEHLEARLKPLFRRPLIVISRKTDEAFILRNASFYLNGKPVYICIQGFPLSIELTLAQLNKETIYEYIDNIDVRKTIQKLSKSLQYLEEKDVLYLDDTINGITLDTLKDYYTPEQIKNFEKEYTDSGKTLKVRDKYTKGFIEFVKSKLVIEDSEKPVIRMNILEKRLIEKTITSYDLKTYLTTGFRKAIISPAYLDVRIIALWISSLIITFLLTALSFNVFGGGLFPIE